MNAPTICPTIDPFTGQPIGQLIGPTIDPGIGPTAGHDPSTDCTAAPTLFSRALVHHRAGEPQDAERCYRAALDADPAHAQALYFLGLLCLRHRTVPEAIDYLDRALALRPHDADWLNDRGIASAALDDHAGAAAFYRRALAHSPHHALAHSNLGKALLQLGAIDDAGQHFAHAHRLDPQLADAMLGCGTVHELQGRRDDALDCYRHAATLAPQDVRPWMAIGHTQMRASAHAAAADAFSEATRRAPTDADAWHRLAQARQNTMQFDAALDAFAHALQLRPHDPTLYNNRAFTLTCCSRYDEADADLHRAIELAPGLSEPRKLLGMSALRRGDFAAGWRDYEHRKTTNAGRAVYTPLGFREWQGEPLYGRRVLLVREQGAGDQLQFVRYAAALAALGASVDVWTSPELAPLFARVDGIEHAFGERPAGGYDYWCQLMSVPCYLDDPVPPARPYLVAEPARALAWQAELAAHAGRCRRIGLVWAGNPAHQLDCFRSMPLAELAPLATLPNVEWYALQKGEAALAQLETIGPDWPIRALGSRFASFDDCAAAIAALDLVISVDTSVAHLAGGMGKPLCVLLPAQSDWRWMSGARTVWYPQARLFRQQRAGDWSDPVEALRAALA